MTRLLLSGALLCAAFAAHAAAPVYSIPRYALAQEDVQASLRAHPDAGPAHGKPDRYAVPVATALSLGAGRWETEGADAVWRLRVHSDGAHSLSLHLAGVKLPPGATLTVGSPAGFAQRALSAQNLATSGLWTGVIDGADLVLEARMPVAAKQAFALGTVEAFHGYRDWKRAATGKSASGACEIDVACSQGDAWRDEARSVAWVTIRNQYYCTGELLNNVRQDKAPLLITADHCGIGSAEDDVGAPSEVNTYFDYQEPSCGSVVPVNPSLSTVGSILLADDEQSDFTLLRLNLNVGSALPADAYFAGWSALGNGSDNGVAIHHPEGDVKKISTYATALAQSAADIGRTCPVDAWQVQWNEGTTEPGSSGGGLWSSTHHLIGTLSGGNASCDTPDGADYFARFDRGWTASPDRAHQLKAHLDPDGTCIAEIAGLDPQQQPNASPITSGPTRCEGTASSCGARGAGGGGVFFLPGLFGALLLRALRRRRRQD